MFMQNVGSYYTEVPRTLPAFAKSKSNPLVFIIGGCAPQGGTDGQQQKRLVQIIELLPQFLIYIKLTFILGSYICF